MSAANAEKLFELLTEARRTNAGVLPKREWLEVVAKFLKDHKGPARKKSATVTDEEWLGALEKDPTLAGVDVRKELGVAQFWLKGKAGRKFTRAFFRNWLIKALERGEVKVDGAGQSSKKRPLPDLYVEPEGWQAVADRLWPGTDIATRKWADLDTTYRRKILEAML